MPVVSYFRDLVEGKRTGVADRLLFFFLTIASFPYGFLLRLRAAAYAGGLLRSFRLPKPVIAVGNLSVGGTGKTPMVGFVARWFMERGKRVVVLSRGYGGSAEGTVRIVADGENLLLSPEQSGDEPYLLAKSVPGLMVVIGTDRYKAGLFAMERLAPDIFILDDGFQHLRLKRDLNILLLDGKKPFGNGLTLPAGLLREPASAAERADLVIYTRCEGFTPEDVTGRPFGIARHKLTGALSLGSQEPLPFRDLSKLRGMAFAGIADPAAFFDSLEKEGLRLVTSLSFPDHCCYGEEEMAAIRRLKDASRSDYLITTGKDAVKLAPYLDDLGSIYSAVLEMEFADFRPLETALEKIKKSPLETL